jgi:DNA processing protein
MVRHVSDHIDDAWAWVALSLVPEIGWAADRYHAALRVDTPPGLFRASRRALAAALGEPLAGAITRFDAARAIAGQAELARLAKARVVRLTDPEYPALLRAVPLPPPYLVVRGSLTPADSLAAAIVGSRRASAYGLRAAEGLAADLAARGVTVVSGFARGVDTAAHRGALRVGGRTVAVLGSGVDVVYPPENARLLPEVLAAGAVVSQFPLGTPPLPGHFPLRNGVIAGASLGTVVVEAARKSGALITARLAGELGREVYAVPGNVSSPGSEGTNGLIQDGAKLVRDWQDVVAEWPREWREALRPAAPAAPAGPNPGAGPAGPVERDVLAAVGPGSEPVALDLLVERSGLPSGRVAAALLSLELRGAVRQLPGHRYVRS